MSGFYILTMFFFNFVQNICNLPKFNFQTGDLAGAVQYNLDQVKVARVHLAPPHHWAGALMLAEPCFLYAALMGGVRGGEFSTLFSTLVRHDTTKPRWNDLQEASHTQGFGGFKI